MAALIVSPAGFASQWSPSPRPVRFGVLKERFPFAWKSRLLLQPSGSTRW